MEEKILSIVVKAVISLVVALITTFLIPAITNWLGNLKNTRLKSFITILFVAIYYTTFIL